MASKEMETLKVSMKMMMERGFAPKFDGSLDVMKLRETIFAAQIHMATEPGVRFEATTFAGIESEISIPESDMDDRAVIIYIHGGGLITGNATSSRGYASMLAGTTKIPVISFSYRLAPEDPFPAAVDDCFAVYQDVLQKYPGKPVFLIGESGGAYLSVVTAMKARDNGVQMPAGIIPYSVPLDFTGRIDRMREGNKDFTVTPGGLPWLGDLYIREEDRENPYATPYLDDMHGMPPVFQAWDESETLAVDCEILRDKLNAQGIENESYTYPDCFHAFATTGHGTPESEEILQNTKVFILRHI